MTLSEIDFYENKSNEIKNDRIKKISERFISYQRSETGFYISSNKDIQRFTITTNPLWCEGESYCPINVGWAIGERYSSWENYVYLKFDDAFMYKSRQRYVCYNIMNQQRSVYGHRSPDFADNPQMTYVFEKKTYDDGIQFTISETKNNSNEDEKSEQSILQDPPFSLFVQKPRHEILEWKMFIETPNSCSYWSKPKKHIDGTIIEIGI